VSAGSSAADKAAALRAQRPRGLRGKLKAALGLDGRERAARDAVAARWDAGAAGERRTGEMLAVLASEGWAGFHDRAFPGGGRANADHILVPPCGTFAVLVDSKLWSARRGVVHGEGGRLWHGREDRQRAMSAVRHEARLLQAALGVPVVVVIAVHSAPVHHGRFTLEGVEVLEAARLLPALRSLVRHRDPGRAHTLAMAAYALPRYTEGSGR
jgi:hypothetical protein